MVIPLEATGSQFSNDMGVSTTSRCNQRIELAAPVAVLDEYFLIVCYPVFYTKDFL